MTRNLPLCDKIGFIELKCPTFSDQGIKCIPPRILQVLLAACCTCMPDVHRPGNLACKAIECRYDVS